MDNEKKVIVKLENIYKSFGKKTVIKNLNLSNLVLETDSPFLTPEPYRGKKNEPSYVYYVADRIAKLKNIDIEEVIKITGENAIREFDLNM